MVQWFWPNLGKKAEVLSENFRLCNFKIDGTFQRSFWQISPLRVLKLSLLNPKENVTCSRSHNSLPSRVSHSFHFTILCHTDTYQVILKLVFSSWGSTLDEGASSCCKYEVCYQHLYYLRALFLAIQNVGTLKGNSEIISLILKYSLVRSNDFPKVTERPWALFLCGFAMQQIKPASPLEGHWAPDNRDLDDQSSCPFAEIDSKFSHDWESPFLLRRIYEPSLS